MSFDKRDKRCYNARVLHCLSLFLSLERAALGKRTSQSFWSDYSGNSGDSEVRESGDSPLVKFVI